MNNIERPGVPPRWLSKWKTVHSNGERWKHTMLGLETPLLENYIQTGTIVLKAGTRTVTADTWISTLMMSAIGSMGQIRLFEYESKAVNEKTLDPQLAQEAFAALYTAKMIEMKRQLLPKHSPYLQNPPVQSFRFGDVPFNAFGVVIGNYEQAFRLARLHLMAHRRGNMMLADHYPMFTFMLRILADFLGEPLPVLRGESLKEPIHLALFDHWRNPDIEVIRPICLASCDLHTHHCKSPGPLQYFEFNQIVLYRHPITILLLFKLRQLLGLENPVLDHPLMNSLLGTLPAEMDFKPDELITRVRARLQQEGYNEDEIFNVSHLG